MDSMGMIEPVKFVAEQAATRILDIYATGFNVTEKADHSPITEADMAAHEVIVAGLSALTPEIPVLSEESQDVSLEQRRRWQTLWLVDPLDGTRQFIRRNDEFSINIALIRGHRPILGLILIPVGGTCYFASHGQGAFKQLAGRPATRVHARPIRESPIQVAGSRGFNSRRLKAYLRKLGQHDYIGMGSSIKSCLVAEGKVDLYPRFGPTSEWDTAAAQIIVEEAGGHLTDANLQPLRYNARPTLINPDFFVFGDASHDWSQYIPVADDND